MSATVFGIAMLLVAAVGFGGSLWLDWRAIRRGKSGTVPGAGGF